MCQPLLTGHIKEKVLKVEMQNPQTPEHQLEKQSLDLVKDCHQKLSVRFLLLSTVCLSGWVCCFVGGV